MIPDVSGPTAPINTPVSAGGTDIRNALVKEQGVFENRIKETADAYRNAVTPEQKAQARQDYANVLSVQKDAIRKDVAAESFANVKQQQDAALRAERVAQGLPAQYSEPLEVARYNQYLQSQKGINPYTIGSAEMTKVAEGKIPGSAGLTVPTPEMEQAAKKAVKEAADEYRALAKDEREMRHQVRGKTEPATRREIRALHAERLQLGVQSGMIDPRNPKAGLDMDRAYQKSLGDQRLARDTASLAGLAEKDIIKGSKEALEKKERQQAIAQQKPSEGEEGERSAAELKEMADLNAQIRQREWLEEQRRRQEAIAGNLYAGR